MRIGDHLTFHARRAFPDPAVSDARAICDSFILTSEAGQILSSLLERLVPGQVSKKGPFLLIGDPGVGKTHTLQFLKCLLDNPENPLWETIQRNLGLQETVFPSVFPRTAVNCLFIRSPRDSSMDLGTFLIDSFHSGASGRTLHSHGAEMATEEFSARARQVAAHLSGQSLGMVVLENVSERIDRINDPEKLIREIRLYRIALEALAQSGVIAILVGRSKHLNRERRSASPLAGLGPSCESLYLSRGNVAEIVATKLSTKDSAQKEKVLQVLSELQKRLPQFAVDAEAFVDLFPIHPELFNTLFTVRDVLPNFSILNFIQNAMQAVLARPEEDLASLDLLFDYILPDLIGCEEYHPFLAAYNDISGKAIPVLKQPIQEKAERLLKTIALSAVFKFPAVSIKALSHLLLLPDEPGSPQGYAGTAALLTEMEEIGKPYLKAAGEELDRSYSLLDFGNPSPAALRNMPGQEEEFRERLQLLIYRWIQAEIPLWRPEFSPRYQRTSQALTASIPEGDPAFSGLVYFKTIFDPCWTNEDLERLEAAAYKWMVIVLNPFEHFYELEPRFKEIATHLKRMMLWRPDKPTRSEIEKLRTFALALSANKPGDELSMGTLPKDIHQIFSSLYVDRGQLISASRQKAICDDIADRSLGRYLSDCLSQAVPGKTFSLQRADLEGQADSDYQAFDWAALLTGRPEMMHSGVEDAVKELIEWWMNSAEGLARKIPDFPEAFMTTRFWRELKFVEGHLLALKPVLQGLRSGEFSLFGAMDTIGRNFAWDKVRVSKWKQSLENLAGLWLWIPTFLHAQDYLRASFPLGMEDLDQTCKDLLQTMEDPCRLLEARRRREFDEKFLKYKKNYMDCYHALHEDALQVISDLKKEALKIDSVAMRNLNLLSGLQYTDKSYLHRVNVLARWIQRNRCDMPVRQILERYPRCYCNFNPCAGRHPAGIATQINGIIQEGIQYFRAVLRRCDRMILEELKSERDENSCGQITAILGEVPLPPLRPQSIRILNRIISKRRSEFLSGVGPR
jgi:hypothetical protein